MNKYYNKFINKNYIDEELFYKISDYSIEKKLKNGIKELDEIEKVFFMVGLLIMEVNSGGFDFYFIDAGGNKYAKETLKFLNEIDENNFSILLNKAINIFNSDKEYDQKFKELDDIDSEFYKFSTPEYNNLYERCIRYLKKNYYI